MTRIAELRVLLIEEESGGWSAQGLEIDIAAQAKTLHELRYEFQKTLMAYVVLNEEENIFEKLGRAPQEYFDMWEASDIEVTTGKDVIQADHLKMPRRHVRVGQLAA